MPTYVYACPKCAHSIEVCKRLADRGTEERCSECGTVMKRDYHAEQPTHHAGGYSRPIISNSLAMSPDQVAEHRRLFPDIRVTPEGQPVFENFQQHDAYLKRIGVEKRPQRIRNRGKRIATQGK